jgi:hypothetical protein
MKIKLAYIIGAIAMASNSNAAIYAVQNVQTGYAYGDGLFQNADNSLLDGGIVAMGVFGGTGFQEFDIATTIGNFQILASAIAGTNSTTLGGSFPGYVQSVFDTANIIDSDPLFGQDLYVFVGNASTLAASTTFGLFKTATIQSDIPNEQTYLANPFSAITADELLLGEVGSFTGNASGLETDTAVFPTLKLAAAAVPEPSAAILCGLGSLMACVRRRRN